MINSIKWWISFRKNCNFWDWVRDAYTHEELQRLMNESTDCSLIRPYNPFADVFISEKGMLRKTTTRLMKRYGDEIWSCCLGAGGYDPQKGSVGLECLSKLDLAFQVCDQKTFEEFLVRNALKRAAQQILEEFKKDS